MSLSDLLARPQPVQAPSLPSLQRIETGVARILARWPDIAVPPDTLDREALVRDMRDRLARHDWGGVTVRRALMGAHAAFDRERRGRTDLDALRDFYLREAQATGSATYLAGMLAVYLGSYLPGAAHSRALGEALAPRRQEIDGRGGMLLTAVPLLLDPTQAHAALAERMAGMAEPFRELKALGVAAPHAPGFMDAVHLAFVAALAPELDRPEALERLMGWLAPEGAAARQEGAREALEAMLRPWTHRRPPDALRRDLAEWIVAHYHDPRVHPGGVWAGFDPDLKAVLFGWLTEADMQFFCDVVTATQDSPMWPPRRDFWLRLHREGRIEQAWVALCPDAENYARRRLMRIGAGNVRRFGRQTAGGGRRTTSLLIMKIGNQIVVDGCHSYKTHLFGINTRVAPKLFQAEYDCEDIRLRATRSRQHHSVESWMNWVEQNI